MKSIRILLADDHTIVRKGLRMLLESLEGFHVVAVAAEGVSEELTEDHKTCIYRIVQEALHNIVQHANARNVRITVTQEPDRLLLSIQDDGRGFNPPQERGMGLIGMEERVSALGGRLVVESVRGEGTTLRVALPLPRAMTAKRLAL